MDRSVVMCPFCDKEQEAEDGKHVIVCGQCGKPFNADTYGHAHPDEFWANPETSARF
jgi:uncharacterized CHY-type Zn-finger protein